ncbi:cytochrome c oxidase assembly protein [Vibrio agarivorans]|uniref:Cytochrome c oxidase assembly protein CtaG n=1 Tax=Vibrio agarivorans TaxID=153622 RepID=A0ABT7Y3F3_9VIBR|nr:cytochrome c oxidase assembly protein [Vibrio agarivorans]MDN2482578.1 cytochrome c oxidase assembly protein [Vibrio agarivorans]
MDTQDKNRKLTVKLFGAVVAMFGFGFALVPLYDVMCDVLGINGKTNASSVSAPVGMQVDISRTIKVEFMSHVTPNMPWRFTPSVTTMEVHPGEVIQTFYLAENRSAADMVGQAVPSVSPGLGASYFNKMECFCFNQQPLSAQASTEMGLIFYIEPDIPDSIHTLTLSYTLYDISDRVDTQATTAQRDDAFSIQRVSFTPNDTAPQPVVVSSQGVTL